MTEDEKQLDRLEATLNRLMKRQDEASVDMAQLRREIFQMRRTLSSTDSSTLSEDKANITESEVTSSTETSTEVKQLPYLERKNKVTPGYYVHPKEEDSRFKLPKLGIDLEKFIGENLISKIGILILIIGVAIGAKYSIENNLISPLTRIVLGYATGIILLGVGMKLKSNYENYSAVLVSGAMAILYFITFMAYSFYGLMPQMAAFGLMVLFTIFTVFAALNYNRQVIAVIGLVGAYAVPFLLSNGSGDYTTLFSYVALVNAGILILAFKKNWKPLYYSAFVLTWMIFLSYLFMGTRDSGFYSVGLIFATIYFVSFYLMFLAFKLINKEQYERLDILMLVANSFLFYSAGYVLLSGSEAGKDMLGIFTIANAVVHFIVSTVLYKMALADRNLFYLVSGLVLVFITIAIPVQLDGSMVTLLWIGLATLLFWIGKTKHIVVYERLAYPIIVLAIGSLFQDWSEVYNHYYRNLTKAQTLKSFLNVQFLASVIFSAGMGFITYLNFTQEDNSDTNKSWFRTAMTLAIPIAFLIILYQTFQLEISNYWNQLLYGSEREIPIAGETYTNRVMNYDYSKLGTVWIVNYTILFASVVATFCMRYIKRKEVAWVAMGLVVLAIFSFLSEGILNLSGLRESYINRATDDVYNHSMANLWMRYVSYGFVGLALWTLYKYVKKDYVASDLNIPFEILLHLVIVWIVSSEIIHLMDLAQSTQSDKLGVSIFWGVYSLALIAYGIWKGKKHLRIGAIVLFAITLIKLFLYDISQLDTIAKTIVFVSLGVLLLIISFLYNKYKHLIVDDKMD